MGPTLPTALAMLLSVASAHDRPSLPVDFAANFSFSTNPNTEFARYTEFHGSLQVMGSRGIAREEQ